MFNFKNSKQKKLMIEALKYYKLEFSSGLNNSNYIIKEISDITKKIKVEKVLNLNIPEKNYLEKALYSFNRYLEIRSYDEAKLKIDYYNYLKDDLKELFYLIQS